MPLIRTRSLAPVVDIIRRYDLVPEAVIEPFGIDIRIYLNAYQIALSKSVPPLVGGVRVETSGHTGCSFGWGPCNFPLIVGSPATTSRYPHVVTNKQEKQTR